VSFCARLFRGTFARLGFFFCASRSRLCSLALARQREPEAATIVGAGRAWRQYRKLHKGYPLRGVFRVAARAFVPRCLSAWCTMSLRERLSAASTASDWRSPRATRLTYEGSTPSFRATRPYMPLTSDAKSWGGFARVDPLIVGCVRDPVRFEDRFFTVRI
jgi:hypothetical protein